MPIISKFYGIIIKMYFLGNEHNPPHIHIFYNDNIAIYDIKNLKIIRGTLPITAEKLVKEWVSIHKDEINNMWLTQKIKKIDPLN